MAGDSPGDVQLCLRGPVLGVAGEDGHELPGGAVLARVQVPHGLVGKVNLSQPLPTLIREILTRVFTEQTPHDSVNGDKMGMLKLQRRQYINIE